MKIPSPCEVKHNQDKTFLDNIEWLRDYLIKYLEDGKTRVCLGVGWASIIKDGNLLAQFKEAGWDIHYKVTQVDYDGSASLIIEMIPIPQ